MLIHFRHFHDTLTAAAAAAIIATPLFSFAISFAFRFSLIATIIYYYFIDISQPDAGHYYDDR
jgi:hypothetical protein